mgnify:CR=1 FL=1
MLLVLPLVLLDVLAVSAVVEAVVDFVSVLDLVSVVERNASRARLTAHPTRQTETIV